MHDMVRIDDPLVSIQGATYCSRGQTLLADISFDIKPDEKLIILGVSGSGKSLLIDILGENVRYSGSVARSDKLSKGDVTISYDTFATFSLLKVREFLSFLSATYQRPMDEALVDALQVRELLEKQIRVLSKGERKRIGVVAALFPQPKLAILDEPTDGMDPILRARFWAVVKARSHAVMLTTHLWDEAQAHHDRIGMMAGGRLLASPACASDLIALAPFSGKIVFIQAAASPPGAQVLRDGERLTVYFQTDQEREAHLEWARKSGVLSRGYSILPVDLIDVYSWLRQLHE